MIVREEDVLRVLCPETELASRLRVRMFGAATDSHKLGVQFTDGLVKFTPDNADLLRLGSTTVRKTAGPQLSIQHDTSKKLDITVDSSGNITLSPTGDINIVGVVTAANLNPTQWDAAYTHSQDPHNYESPLTFNTGLSRAGNTVTNSDRGSAARTAHEAAWDHDSFLTSLPSHTHPYLPLSGGTLTDQTRLIGQTTTIGGAAGDTDNIKNNAHFYIQGGSGVLGLDDNQIATNTILQFNSIEEMRFRPSNMSSDALAFRDTGAEFAVDVTAPNLNIDNWNTAHGWGDHADAGYIAGTLTSGRMLVATGAHSVGNSVVSADASKIEVAGRCYSHEFRHLASAGSVALNINAANNDTRVWKVTADDGNGFDAEYFGFYLKYTGTLSGNQNSLELWTHGQNASDVLSYRILQDGSFSLPNISEVTSHDGKFVVCRGSDKRLETVHAGLDDLKDVAPVDYCGTNKAVLFFDKGGTDIWEPEEIPSQSYTYLKNGYEKWTSDGVTVFKKTVTVEIADGASRTLGTLLNETISNDMIGWVTVLMRNPTTPANNKFGKAYVSQSGGQMIVDIWGMSSSDTSGDLCFYWDSGTGDFRLKNNMASADSSPIHFTFEGII